MTLRSIFCSSYDWNLMQLTIFLQIHLHKSRYVCEWPKGCMMQGWTTEVFLKTKYIQIGKSKFRWMKGGKGAIIDGCAWAQAVPGTLISLYSFGLWEILCQKAIYFWSRSIEIEVSFWISFTGLTFRYISKIHAIFKLCKVNQKPNRKESFFAHNSKKLACPNSFQQKDSFK